MLILSTFVYTGLAALLVGAVGLVRPGWPGVRSRARAATIAAGGAVLVATGYLWPTPILRSRGTSVIDRAMPEYQFAEHHETFVAAAPDVVFAALRQVTAGEISFFRLLTRIRNPMPGGAESILNAPPDKPLLAVALSSGFHVVSEHDASELVIGTPVAATVRAVMNFRIVPARGGSLLSTETRVLTSEPSGLRAFTAYWRLIYPGSALIRVEWLAAIKARAERRR